ncbi:MAG TPA: serine/threonine-protein kinase [Bryobacteraceae bacterium]|nr:serine/threonine-protein kinase [Bryobacteraceae bacterium]
MTTRLPNAADPSPQSSAAAAVLAPPSPPAPSSISSSLTTGFNDCRFFPGTLIVGRYRVIELLGRGGMGEVYRAADLALEQTVALKFLPCDASRDKRLLQLFHNEARVARQVTHPNVCRVYDIGETDGLPFISMEYVDGEDIAALLHRIGSLPPTKALEITRELFAGLAAAHARGVIHRDLKPHNVMLNKQGRTVIMDFGLAAIASQIEGIEARSGSPSYMAPEQLSGSSASAKSDLYSAGLIAYQLFTGKRAFEGASIAELLHAEEATEPERISAIVPDIDPQTERAIMLCIQPEPSQRPSSARAVASALPGGDPLSAALAAGETPSPDIVAAAGKAAGVRLRFAILCLATVIACLILVPVVGRHLSILSITPLDYSPPVLEQKARDLAASFGYNSKPRDWDSWFEYDRPSIDFFQTRKHSESWSAIFQKHSAINFYYRQSDHYLVSLPDGILSADRPPVNKPGNVEILLDSQGHLLQFVAAVPAYGDINPPSPITSASLSEKLGFDLTRFQETSPTYIPEVVFDQRRAWMGSLFGVADGQTTVEIATWRGALTSLWIRWPWIPKPGITTHERLFESTTTYIYNLFCVVGLIVAFFLARRNLRLGRVDRRGAFRVACAAFFLAVASASFMVHFVPSVQMSDVAFETISDGLARGMILWLLYLASEPTVRARWPHSIITWNRALAGQISDPRVASDILVGAATGMLMLYLFLARTLWFVSHGAPPDGPSARILGGLGELLSKLSSRGVAALLWASAILLVVCGARALLHTDWLAALTAGAFMTFIEGGVRHSPTVSIDASVYFLFYSGIAFLLVRAGLLSAVSTIFVIDVAGDIPISSSFSAWYNWEAAVNISIIAVIAIYGFNKSQASPTAADPLFSGISSRAIAA